jgi:hypothetical protein
VPRVIRQLPAMIRRARPIAIIATLRPLQRFAA